MKWLLVKLVLIAYISSLIVFIMFFPEIGLKEEEFDLKCKRKIDRIILKYEYVLNETFKNQTGKLGQAEHTLSQGGPGAYGVDFNLNNVELSPAEREERERLLAQYDYDAFISDMVSIYRVLPDNRPDVCKNKVYGDLPEVSIIIPFRDERRSVLLRTVHSILQNTPDKLLAEIILIDDGSETAELKSKLQAHVQSVPKIQLVRLYPSAGLMVARQTGIDRCKADYFITMDCHIEVVRGWLEPLLFRLKQNPKACLSPNVGLLKRDTFGVDLTTRWTFNKFPMFVFNGEEAHSFYKPDYLANTNRSEPMPTGMNQGMVIAMKKSWFKQLGGFDTGMRVWGSEQIELSVKVWTCGGIVEIIPCSYVAHLFKTRLVWTNMGLAKITNILRFAEVWMDNYKEMLYKYWPSIKQDIDLGPDLRERKVIRRQNHCKPFQYYIDKVKEFGIIHFPENLRNYGWMENEDTGLCIVKEPTLVTLSLCSKYKGGLQFLEHTEEFHLRHDGVCLYPISDTQLWSEECYALSPEKSQWLYTADRELVHRHTNKCLTIPLQNHQLVLGTCVGKSNQRWTWKLWDS